MSLERRVSVILVTQLRTGGVSDHGYELATPFLHGGRQFLQAPRAQIRIFRPKNEHFDVRSASRSERDSGRDSSGNLRGSASRTWVAARAEPRTDLATEASRKCERT